MGEFKILDIDSVEIVQAGQYYGTRRTSNEAESFTIQDAM